MFQFYVIGGEFSSLNFHSFVPGSSLVLGPYKSRFEAENHWREVSEEHRHQANYRFIIVEEEGE